MRYPVFTGHAAREWYEHVPKWVLANVLRQIAAKQSPAECETQRRMRNFEH